MTRVRSAACRRVALAAAVLAAACVGTASASSERAPSPHDPWESWNRGVDDFNRAVDEALLKPVAVGYRDVVPFLMRQWVENFFGNFRDAWSAVNHLLQAKPMDAVHMSVRVMTNSFFGFGGINDVATDVGLDRRAEDFGQTLGRWGMPPGPYLVLPLLGPSTVRDTAALTLDLQAAPTIFLGVAPGRVGVTILGIVNARASLLDATHLLESISLDRYQFTRDAWLARRQSLVNDGRSVPSDEEPFDYNIDDEESPPATPPSPPAPPSPSAAPAAPAERDATAPQ